MFEAHADVWQELLIQSAPSTDLGRARSTSSQIPNLGHSRIEEALRDKYDFKHFIFTNCATDALDLTVQLRPEPVWYAPSYTWLSPINALYKAGKEIRFLDVDPETRMVDFAKYDPEFPIVVPHCDGLASPKPKTNAFILEDAAQSPLHPEIGFGDVTIISFGSSKRLGLLGQGGCAMTNNDELAEKLKQSTVFGLNGNYELVDPGDKSFLDPYNAMCTAKIFEFYQDSKRLNRLNQVRAAFNEASGYSRGEWLERYTLQVENRDQVRSEFHESGIETRVWFPKHTAAWPTYSKFKAELPVTEQVAAQSFDVPYNEYLTDIEVEKICGELRKRSFIHN